MIAFLAYKHTVLGHAQSFILQYTQVLLCRCLLDQFILQSVLILGTVPTQVEDIALDPVEFHEFHMALQKQ